MTTKRSVIFLSGGGDSCINLVTEDVFRWITSEYESDNSSHQEKLPDAVFDEVKRWTAAAYWKDTVYVSRGSYENDRALQAPGQPFNSMKELMKFVKENDIEIVDEFHGLIY